MAKWQVIHALKMARMYDADNVVIDDCGRLIIEADAKPVAIYASGCWDRVERVLLTPEREEGRAA